MKRSPEDSPCRCLNQAEEKRAREEANDTSSSIDFHHYQRASNYNFLENIGHGICGTVYKAEEKETKRRVAIKMIKYDETFVSVDPSDIREVQIHQTIHHKNVVEMYGVVKREESREIGIVLEYMDFSLPSFMNKVRTRLSEHQAGYLIYHLLCGVKYLHALGIIHRDIKLGNLLLDRDGHLKIADFGTACVCPTDSLPYDKQFGTIWYRAPELLLECVSYSSKVDIWSVGCVFALLLMKKPLFGGANEEDQIDKIFHILGTPNEVSWPGVNSFPGMQRYLLSTPSPHVGCLLKGVKGLNASQKGLQLLERRNS
nr:hypothetical protein HmN_000210200 [Hymenolepis microstoma]